MPQVPDGWTSLLTGVPIALASMYSELLTSSGIEAVTRADPNSESIYGVGAQFQQEILVRTSAVEKALEILDPDPRYRAL